MANLSPKILRWGLAIDWETSGYTLPDYTTSHQGISFGAIIYDSLTFEPVEELYREIKFDGSKYQWSSDAERIHGISRDYLAVNGAAPEEAAAELANLVLKYAGTETVQVLGHRVRFDIAFTNQLTDTIGFRLPWHPTIIDSSAFATVLLEVERSNDLFELAGFPPRGAHNSLEDIRYTLRAVKWMKENFIVGLASSLD